MNQVMMNYQEYCRVCGETSSTGWHCGAITCEACKKFFLRNVKGDHEAFKCHNNSNCVITKTTRTNCAFCRFQKCIQVGMVTGRTQEEAVCFKNIPCSVCMDASSGLHFGAITCDGCKGFFRRNISEGPNFSCESNNNCDINFQNRNSCKACRFNKCIQVGMDMKSCKVGRLSKLFKRQLKSSLGESVSCNTNIKSADFSTQIYNDTINIEDLFDVNTKSLIKHTTQALYYLLQGDKQGINYMTAYEDHKLALDLIKDLHETCAYFVFNTTFLHRFPIEDQKIIITNSLHSLQLLKVIRKSEYLNYFNIAPEIFNRICKVFPVFIQVDGFLKDVALFLRSINMDDKEYGLLLAYVAFSLGSLNIENIEMLFQVNSEIVDALSKYMSKRRNEGESCENLISCTHKFTNITVLIEKEMNMKLNQLQYGNNNFYNSMF